MTAASTQRPILRMITPLWLMGRARAARSYVFSTACSAFAAAAIKASEMAHDVAVGVEHADVGDGLRRKSRLPVLGDKDRWGRLVHASYQNTRTFSASSVAAAGVAMSLRLAPSISSPSAMPRASMQVPQTRTRLSPPVTRRSMRSSE